MLTYRTYGTPPYTVAVIHGGPGATGEMAPVAKELSAYYGVVEPLQTADTLEGQIEELYTTLTQLTRMPVCLIGHSWGAWLATMVAAYYPHSTHKLILVNSGSFESSYAETLMPKRLEKLNGEEQKEVAALLDALQRQGVHIDNNAFKRFGELLEKADSFDLIEEKEPNGLVYDAHIFQKVWPEAAELRRSGMLLALAGRISCPVVAIHGIQDPSPYAGVHKPLTEVLSRFNGILLDQCGHTPWKEKNASSMFFNILRNEIGTCT